MLKGIYSVVFTINDLTAATEWYRTVFQIDPYINNDSYSGFNIGGSELGLQTGRPATDSGPLIYFLVDDIRELTDRVLDLGGSLEEPVLHIGGPVYTSIVRDPFNNLIGLIENPKYCPVL